MSDRKIRVLVCRVGEQPKVEEVEPTLKGMRTIIDGHVQCVPLEDGVDLWCDEEGGPNCKGLPFNRSVEVIAPTLPPAGWTLITTEDAVFSTAPGSARGYHLMHGPFFLARREESDEGDVSVSLTDGDIAAWQFKLWLGQAPEHVALVGAREDEEVN